MGNAPGAISIGDDVRILRGATISTTPNGKIIIGDRVHTGEGTIIFGGQSIKIGNDVIIGPQNDIVDSDHRYQDLLKLRDHEGGDPRKGSSNRSGSRSKEEHPSLLHCRRGPCEGHQET